VRDVSILEPSDEVEVDVITTEVVEQPSAVPEEDLNQVDLHLVHMPGSEERLGRARPVAMTARSPAASRAQVSTSATNCAWPGGTSPSSTRWVRTKIGTPS
jgi:hypothetical protein